MMKRIVLSIELVFAMLVSADAQKKSALTKIVESGELKVGTKVLMEEEVGYIILIIVIENLIVLLI